MRQPDGVSTTSTTGGSPQARKTSSPAHRCQSRRRTSRMAISAESRATNRVPMVRNGVRHVRQIDGPAVDRLKRPPPAVDRPRWMEVGIDEVSALRQHACQPFHPAGESATSPAIREALTRSNVLLTNGSERASPHTRGARNDTRASIVDEKSRPMTNDAPAAASTGQVAARPGAHIQRARRVQRVDDACHLVLFGAHQGVVCRGWIGSCPQVVRGPRGQSGLEMCHVRTPSFPGADSGSADAAPATRTARGTTSARTARRWRPSAPPDANRGATDR